MKRGLSKEVLDDLRANEQAKYAGYPDAEVERTFTNLQVISTEALALELAQRGWRVELHQ